MSGTLANSGVGFAIANAIACASEDLHLIMAGRSLKKAKSAMSDIEAAGTKGLLPTVQLDFLNERSIEQAVVLVHQKFGRLDVLVNNAAVGSRDTDAKTRFQLRMNTDVIGPAVVSAAFKPLLLNSQKLYSVFVSSGVGSMTRAPDPTWATYRSLSNGEAYRTSKAALNMIALQESIEFSSTAVKVFAVCLGFVRSNLRGQSEDAMSGEIKAGAPQFLKR